MDSKKIKRLTIVALIMLSATSVSMIAAQTASASNSSTLAEKLPKTFSIVGSSDYNLKIESDFRFVQTTPLTEVTPLITLPMAPTFTSASASSSPQTSINDQSSGYDNSATIGIVIVAIVLVAIVAFLLSIERHEAKRKNMKKTGSELNEGNFTAKISL